MSARKKNGWMISGNQDRVYAICLSGKFVRFPMAFVYAFVRRPGFPAVINAANKGNIRFDRDNIQTKNEVGIVPFERAWFLGFRIFGDIILADDFFWEYSIRPKRKFSLWKNLISQFLDFQYYSWQWFLLRNKIFDSEDLFFGKRDMKFEIWREEIWKLIRSFSPTLFISTIS